MLKLTECETENDKHIFRIEMSFTFLSQLRLQLEKTFEKFWWIFLADDRSIDSQTWCSKKNFLRTQIKFDSKTAEEGNEG